MSLTSVSFQEGIDGYAGAFERLISTTVSAELPSASNPTPENWFVDGGGTASSPDQQALIRFDNIIGASIGQIPAGATILDAKLTLTTAPSTVSNAQTNGFFYVAGLTSAFNASTTYTNYGALGPYYQNGQTATRSTGGFYDNADPAVGDTDSTIDPDQVVSAPVTALVQRWVNGSLGNYGFAVQAGRPQSTTDGWAFGTKHNSDAARRPKLEVTYTTDPVETFTFQQGVNGYTGTTMGWLKQDNAAGSFDGSAISQAFLDGPATGSPDDQALIRFDNLFTDQGGSIPRDADIIQAKLVITTATASDNAQTRGGYDIHQVLTDWDTDENGGLPTLYSEWNGDGPTIADNEIGPAVDRANAIARDGQAFFDITQVLKNWQAGEDNFGLNIRAGNTSDGWQIFFTGAANELVRPQLVVLATVSSTLWANDADGNWSSTTSWQGGTTPNAISARVTFGNVLTAPHTVTVDAPQTAGKILFDSPFSYTLAGPGTITLASASGPASLKVASGTHTISAPLSLNSDLQLDTAAGTGLAITGEMSAAGRNISKIGAGSVQLENVRAASLAVSDGVVKVSAKASANTPEGTSVVSSVVIAPGAQLDLTNNGTIIDYATSAGTLVEDMRTALQQGRLTSSSADAIHRLGYADNAVLGLSAFAGQSVDADSLLIKFTFTGDANLDGQVDITDLASLATAWQISGTWINGDFDYSGFIDITDLAALATNWQAGVGAPLSMSFEQALASIGLGGTVVPEPALATLFAVTTAGLIAPRRRVR